MFLWLLKDFLSVASFNFISFSIPVVSTTRDAYAYDSEWRWRNTEHLTWIPKAKNLCNDVLPSISNIIMPDKETLVSDAGKLSVLDGLLVKLKAEGHRVLIYSQMTRMIDLLEEYMNHRKHTYIRLVFKPSFFPSTVSAPS